MNKSITKNYMYRFNNKIHNFKIEINTDNFLPGSDSLAYVNNSEYYIASIDINDYKIILKATETSFIVNENTDETYVDFIPEFLTHLLDRNAELNLNKWGYTIEARNHFEYLLFKKEENTYREYSLDFHKTMNVLDSTIDSFFEELKTVAIYFIQGDYLDSIDVYYNEDEGYLPPLAADDFASFCDHNAYNVECKLDGFLFY